MTPPAPRVRFTTSLGQRITFGGGGLVVEPGQLRCSWRTWTVQPGDASEYLRVFPRGRTRWWGVAVGAWADHGLPAEPCGLAIGRAELWPRRPVRLLVSFAAREHAADWVDTGLVFLPGWTEAFCAELSALTDQALAGTLSLATLESHSRAARCAGWHEPQPHCGYPAYTTHDARRPPGPASWSLLAATAALAIAAGCIVVSPLMGALFVVLIAVGLLAAVMSSQHGVELRPGAVVPDRRFPEPVSMREPRFEVAVGPRGRWSVVAVGDGGRRVPLPLLCHRGGRSNRLRVSYDSTDTYDTPAVWGQDGAAIVEHLTVAARAINADPARCGPQPGTPHGAPRPGIWS